LPEACGQFKRKFTRQETNMEKFTRRDFLKTSSSLAVAAGVLGRSMRVLAAKPHMKFPSEPRERLGVASYPFRDFIKNSRHPERAAKEPALDIKDFGAMVVQKFHAPNIEPWSHHFESTDPAYIAELRAAFEKAGAHVINIPSDIGHSVYDPDAAQRAAAVSDGKKWVDVAASLGSPSVRIHIAGVRGVQPDVDRAAGSLGEIAEYGAKKNIQVNLENDDLTSEDALFIVKVIEKANQPYLHALPDFGNSMMGGDADFNYRAVKAMFEHAYNISHVKEGEAGDDGKFVPVDVSKTFGIAKAAGYRGYFSMEMDRPGDPYEGTQNLIDLSLKYLA
jgi:sugar phosphate isomerase/epimerase